MTDEKNTPETDPAAEPAVAPVTDAAAAEPREGEAAASGRDEDVTYASFADAFEAVTDGPEGVDASAPPQYGVGPFSIREVALGAVWLLAFVFSFFPIYDYGRAGAGPSVWTGIDWLLTIGTPTIAVFLLGLRRLSPQGIRRVGSLGIDQFASVAFSVSAIIWLGLLWSSFVSVSGTGIFLSTWVVWVEFILMLAGVLLTVFAPLFPTIGDDFRHRPEVPAHRFASPARPVVARPAAPRPAPAPAAAAHTESPYESPYGTDAAAAAAPVAETVVPETTVIADVETAPPASQAFWALAPVERDVVDENGVPLFTIGPTAWALVIEDRGDSFVVRHEDGRIGYLRDVSGVTRG